MNRSAIANSASEPDALASTVPSQIRAAIQLLRVTDDHVFELRALAVPARYGPGITVAGWFDDTEALVREAARLDLRGGQVYVTINCLNPALLARGYNRVIERPKATTCDDDITRRVWLPIDVDPVRPSGISASADELLSAKQRAIDVADWLRQELNEDPTIWAFSGNGYHLLFRIDLPNNDESGTIVKGLIDTASDRFSDERVTIDRTVCNAARIWRLYDTMNRKGDSVPKLGRVHRAAAVLGPGFIE